MTPDDDVISRKAAMKAASAAVMQPWDWRGNEHDFQLWNAGAKMAFDNVSKVPAAAPVVPSEPLEWFFNDLPHPFWYAQDEDESGLFSIVKGRTGTLGADMWTLMLGDITLFGADDPEYLKNRAQQIQDAIENASPVTQLTRERLNEIMETLPCFESHQHVNGFRVCQRCLEQTACKNFIDALLAQGETT